MADRLTIDDADGLRDLADRSRRAARTARRTAQAQPLNSDAEAMLLDVADRAGALAESADTLAEWLEHGGPNRTTGVPAQGGQLMGERLGYVVAVVNQASGEPGYMSSTILHSDLAGAEWERDLQQDETAEAGRPERYIVCEVIPVSDDGN